MKAINYACLKLEEKNPLEVLKRIKTIKVIGDKFAISIRWGKLTISFF